MFIAKFWVNQPSKLQEFHHLHGKNVLAVEDYRVDEINSDEIWVGVIRNNKDSHVVINTIIKRNVLAMGWHE